MKLDFEVKYSNHKTGREVQVLKYARALVTINTTYYKSLGKISIGKNSNEKMESGKKSKEK